MATARLTKQSVGLRGASEIGSSKVSSVSSVSIVGDRSRTIAITASSGKIVVSESQPSRETPKRAKGTK